MTEAIFLAAAAADVEEAYVWYEAQRLGLGNEFLAEVRNAADSIASRPLLNKIMHRATRRALLRRFPYGIFYRTTSEQVIVIACMHCSRNPRAWKRRE